MAVITAQQAGCQAIVTALDLVAWSEGTSTSQLTRNDGYDVEVTGINGPAIFTEYVSHPFEYKPATTVKLVPLLKSTAAGRYQLLYRYFIAYKHQLNLKDFSPLSQDLIAIQQMREKHATELLKAGAIREAIESLAPVWASLPGNSYGQGGHSIDTLLNKWKELANVQ